MASRKIVLRLVDVALKDKQHLVELGFSEDEAVLIIEKFEKGEYTFI